MRESIVTFFTALILAVTLATPVQADSITVGWTAWPDAEFVNKLTATILQDRLGQDVELVQTDIAAQYQALVDGEIDLMLMAWLPSTHEDYMDSVATDIVSLGTLYGYARLGWAVPAYVPEDQLSSIEDLDNAEVRDKLGGTITGIDPGAGLTRLSRQAIEDYQLDGYELQTSSGSGMTEALEQAIDEGEWIVVTGWSPHWKFGAWDLRYIEDPRGVLGSWERIHAIAREGFYQDNIEAATMLARMWIPLDDLQAAMYNARENSYEQAVTEYIEDNEKRVSYWVTGEM